MKRIKGIIGMIGLILTSSPRLTAALAGLALLTGGVAIKTDLAFASILLGSLLLIASVYAATSGGRGRANG